MSNLAHPSNLWFARLGLIAGLLLVPIASQAAPPAEPAATSPTVRVVVDAASLGPDGPYFETEIAQQIAAGLAAEGFTVSERGGSTVRIKLEVFDEHDRDFLIATDVVREGRMAVSQKPSKCPSCIDEELVAAAVAMLPELIEALRSDPQQLPSEGTDNPEPPPGDGDGDTAMLEPATVPAIGPLGGVGIGVAVLGLGGVVWGAVELSKGRVYETDPDSVALYRTGLDHTPRGQILIGVGIAGVVVGGAMLISDVAVRSKRRNPKIAFVPLVSPAALGLGWAGRF